MQESREIEEEELALQQGLAMPEQVYHDEEAAVEPATAPVANHQ